MGREDHFTILASAKAHPKTWQITYMALFVALISIGAFLKIPVPVVPFTLQFLFTMLAGLLLGGKNGAICVAVYIALGLLGLPIFAEGGGIAYVLKPSFGYLIGFCAGSCATGILAERKADATFKHILLYNLIGLLIVYGAGMVYYYILCNYVISTPIELWPLFLYCFLLAVPGDILLCVLAAMSYKRLRQAVNKLR